YSLVKYWSRMGYEICVIAAEKNHRDGSLDLRINADVATSVRIEETAYKSLRRKPFPHCGFFQQSASPLKYISSGLMIWW
ncbi:MAG: hypothetical protein AAB332_00280, partial [Planctomycetota bacterium]